MEQIAFIAGNHILYWKNIVLAMAVLTSVCAFLAFYWGSGGKLHSGLAVVPLAMAISLVLSRILHWYCYTETYPSLLAALRDYSTGGFALLGCFAGCFLAASATRGLRIHRNLPQMLDCMCLAGGIGISLGRLASFFDVSDRGQIIESIQTMPWVYPVTNMVSGSVEYRLATFLLQAMITAVLVIGLTCYFFKARKSGKFGDTALLFFLLYCAAQIVLDSTRYDSMYFHFNRFIGIVQVVAAIVLVAILVIISVGFVKARGFRLWYVALWLLQAGGIGCGGFMEYYVQRHGNEAAFAYSIMSGCLLAVCAIAIGMHAFTPHHAARYEKT